MTSFTILLIPDTSSLVTTAVSNTKISEVENKIADNSIYITTQKLNKLTVQNLSARLKQADLVKKTDFDNKLTSFNRRIASNKPKYLEVQNKLNSLITKDFFKIFSYVEFILQVMMDLKTCLIINQHLTH